MNGEASELSNRINQVQLGHAARGLLPREIIELCKEIRSLLKRQHGTPVLEPPEHCRLVGHPERPVLLRGLGLPNAANFSQGRILIFMERIGVRDHLSLGHAMQQYHLTGREQTVLLQLSKGLTNKEIANSLSIVEQTVKGHIKRLMTKMQVTTRTGLLSRLLETICNHASHTHPPASISASPSPLPPARGRGLR
jgi:DNA-binding CsgD family transcriptional regulator